MNLGPYVVDHPEGRAFLLAENAQIFGMEAIEKAFELWDTIVPNGHDDNIVSLDRVKEIYYGSTDSTEDDGSASGNHVR